MSRKRLVEARSPEYAALGQRLAQAREALSLSQVEAAKLIGISQGTYSGYETGTRRINLPMLQRIADVCHTVELNDIALFSELFMEYMTFPDDE